MKICLLFHEMLAYANQSFQELAGANSEAQLVIANYWLASANSSSQLAYANSKLASRVGVC